MNALTPARWSSERGSVLVYVAVAILGLVAFSALSIDYGVMWMSRRQAQNAADAAALAAAATLAFDAPNDFDRARATAKTIGELNKVFGGTLNITQGSGADDDITQDISFPTCPAGTPGPPDSCVRVNVYRTNLAQGGFPAKDPLPVFFAPLFGRTMQGVRATATAQILSVDESDCLKPWAVADKWGEAVECTNYHNNGNCIGTWVASTVWDETKTFDKYDDGALNPAVNPPAPLGPDYVRAPGTNGPNDPGTGFQPFNADGTPGPDYGRLLMLKQGSGGGPNERYSAGWFQKLNLPCPDPPNGCPNSNGADKYKWQIQNCIRVPFGIGDTLTFDNSTGNTTGPTSQATYGGNGGGPNGEMGLWERDPLARWNNTTKSIENSCAPGVCADGRYYAQSPRIVAVPTFNLDAYLAADPNGSGQTVTVSNIFGFFIVHPDEAEDLGFDLGTGNPNDNVVGALVSVPGQYSGSNTVSTAAFLRQVILVR